MKISSKHQKSKKELKPFYLYIKETEKKRKKEYENFLEKASEKFSVPKDVFAGQPIINLMGNHRIRICNYRSVSEYTSERICLSLSKRNIWIQGNHLLIESLQREEINIVGNILNVSFEGIK